jgi:hypothetical protein
VSVASAIDAVRSRTVIALEWQLTNPPNHQFTNSPIHQSTNWSAWAVTLPSGLHVYCDGGGGEYRLLASVKRGSAMEADRFFLELLAESRGRHFGIEMDGAAPDRIRTSIDDRAFLADVFVDLFEGTEAEAEIRARTAPSADFRLDVERWLAEVLTAPSPPRRPTSYPRLREL